MVFQMGASTGAPQLWSGQTEAFPRSVPCHLASSPAEHTCKASQINNKHTHESQVSRKDILGGSKTHMPLVPVLAKEIKQGLQAIPVAEQNRRQVPVEKLHAISNRRRATRT